MTAADDIEPIQAVHADIATFKYKQRGPNMRGSCFCGACVFELNGRISALGKCHCSKCRKVSGTGSNAVLWARPQNLAWISGEDNVSSYQPATGWGTAFCTTCGSPLPILDTEGGKWFVSAGLLDDDPEVTVRGHIWVSSKPSWEVIGDDAPQFDGEP